MNKRPPEYWDLFDKLSHKPVGKFVKHRRIPPHLYHNTVEIIVTDMKGYILITRRSLKKRNGGGLFEFPAGSVKAGETTAMAAVRELREETGLRLKTLTLLSQKLIGEMMRHIYLGYLPDLQTATIQLNPYETVDYKIITYPQWIEYMRMGYFDLSRTIAYSQELYDTVMEKIGIAMDQQQSVTQRVYARCLDFGAHIKPFVPVCDDNIDEDEACEWENDELITDNIIWE